MQDSSQNGQLYSTSRDDPYASTAQEPEAPNMIQDISSIKWTASEFVHHEKKATWYMGLAAITVGIAIVAYFITAKDIFTLIIIGVLGIVFGIAASRKPRVLEYEVGDFGIVAGQKHYKYDDFKSYALDKDSTLSSLIFMPVKRFSPSLTLYVPSENISNVMDLIGVYLPLENHEVGYVDKILNKIHF